MRKIDLKSETAFENKKASGSDVRSSQSKFYWATSVPINEHNNNICRVINGKSVLEIGCASGKEAEIYTKYCSSYIGIDISDIAIENAKALKIENAIFLCVDGHKIPSENSKFDFVIVNSLLHHLDLEVTLKEIHRVLKGDGALLFREPLGTNPIFQLYRFLTPSARTNDERPFTFSDISLMKYYFILDNVRWIGFFSILSAFVRLKSFRTLMTYLDKAMSFTPAKYIFWQFAGSARKKP